MNARIHPTLPAKPGLPAPAAKWLVAGVLATLPAWRWSAERFLDGSDDPLGLIALVSLLYFVGRDRARLGLEPHPLYASLAALAFAGFLGLRMGGSAALLSTAVACISICLVWLALLRDRRFVAPILGLAFLALPIVASLQFYAGFPLRLITAQLSVWGLTALGAEAVREGASVLVNGTLVIVDAPCSGVQMGWFAYFSACASAASFGLLNRTFALRLPAIGVLVLLANASRNVLLMGGEARLFGALGTSSLWHETVGLGCLLVLCAAIVWLMKAART